MIKNIELYILIFFIYAFAGWCLESIGSIFNPKVKKFINRGFLIGPYCPIYGYGALLITFLLKKYTNDPITLFIMVILVCGILEYLTSYFMEKIFKARWWDYSTKKFNINGRICLDTMIPFGIGGVLFLYVMQPIFEKLVGKLKKKQLNTVFWIVIGIFIVDIIVNVASLLI